MDQQTQDQVNVMDQRIAAAEMDVFQARENLTEAEALGEEQNVGEFKKQLDAAEAKLNHRKDRRKAIAK